MPKSEVDFHELEQEGKELIFVKITPSIDRYQFTPWLTTYLIYDWEWAKVAVLHSSERYLLPTPIVIIQTALYFERFLVLYFWDWDLLVFTCSFQRIKRSQFFKFF